MKTGLLAYLIFQNFHSISPWFSSTNAQTTDNAGTISPGDDPLDWLRDSIPGEPGVDYPIFAEVQDTAFSCEGRKFGGKEVLTQPSSDLLLGCEALLNIHMQFNMRILPASIEVKQHPLIYFIQVDSSLV